MLQSLGYLDLQISCNHEKGKESLQCSVCLWINKKNVMFVVFFRMCRYWTFTSFRMVTVVLLHAVVYFPLTACLHMFYASWCVGFLFGHEIPSVQLPQWQQVKDLIGGKCLFLFLIITWTSANQRANEQGWNPWVLWGRTVLQHHTKSLFLPERRWDANFYHIVNAQSVCLLHEVGSLLHSRSNIAIVSEWVVLGFTGIRGLWLSCGFWPSLRNAHVGRVDFCPELKEFFFSLSLLLWCAFKIRFMFSKLMQVK